MPGARFVCLPAVIALVLGQLPANVEDAPPLSRMLEKSEVNQIAALIKSKVENNWSVPAGGAGQIFHRERLTEYIWVG
jgi:ABC-type tungstate transport system substrate-binding protein